MQRGGGRSTLFCAGQSLEGISKTVLKRVSEKGRLLKDFSWVVLKRIQDTRRRGVLVQRGAGRSTFFCGGQSLEDIFKTVLKRVLKGVLKISTALKRCLEEKDYLEDVYWG